MSMNSVERTTMIELFSTFYDRLIINNPNRDNMLKQLYQFKSHLYSNEQMKTYFEELSTFSNSLMPPKIEQKSPSTRQPRQKSKDMEMEIVKARLNKQTFDKKIITSCHHEFERMAFEQYVNLQFSEFGQVKCPQCQQTILLAEYESFIYRNQQPFEELKNKFCNLLKVLAYIDKSTAEFIQIINTMDQDDQNKQRCFSGAIEYYREQSPILSNLSSIGYSRLGDDKPMALSNQTNLSMMKKCLRCNKDVGNKENKGPSNYFCIACRNL